MHHLDDFQPELSPAPEAAEYYEGAARGVLRLPWCTVCERPHFYPRIMCPHCGSAALEWRDSAGVGEVYSWCIPASSRVPGLEAAAPFVTALIELDEGVRILSVLVGVEPTPDEVRCGMRVQVRFHLTRSGVSLPVFAPMPDPAQ